MTESPSVARSLRPPERRLLVALAHPDDECFGAGGTTALHANNGVPTTYICATSGSMGRHMGNPPFATRETLYSLREKELQASCEALGITDPRPLRIWDKTVEFVDPEWLKDEVLGVMREVVPSLIITFHPKYGGHPDHCAIGEATLRAARQWAQELRDGGREEDVPRLLHIPAWREDVKTDLETVTYNIAPYADAKKASRAAHKSQTGLGDSGRRNLLFLWRHRGMIARFRRAMREEHFWLQPL